MPSVYVWNSACRPSVGAFRLFGVDAPGAIAAGGHPSW